MTSGSTPPPPDPPHMSPKGKWGVAPSDSQLVPRSSRSRTGPGVWWALAALIVVAIVLIIVLA